MAMKLLSVLSAGQIRLYGAVRRTRLKHATVEKLSCTMTKNCR